MKFVKITKDNLPKFDEIVFLLERTKDSNKVTIGSLKSIDSKGYNWVSHISNASTTFEQLAEEVFAGFGGLSLKETKSSAFKPNYFAYIELPEDEFPINTKKD